MHIGLFSPALPSTDSANGIVTYVRFMRAALSELDHRVTVIAPQGIERPGGSIELNVRDRSITNRILGIAKHLRREQDGPISRHSEISSVVTAVHRADPFDVFEMEESFGWIGKLGLDVPVVARLHGPHFLGKDHSEPLEIARISAARIAAEGSAIGAVAGITSPSARLLAATLKHYAINPKHAAPIYNPIPVAPAERCWAIDRCNPNQILFVGRFDLRKGADIALAAFALAAARNPHLQLVMCGPDPGILDNAAEPIHFSQYLQERFPAELRTRIRYLGAVTPKKIETLRLESALCLSTSRFEVFAYSMTEALAVGMPLIASDTFGMIELLHHRETGYIVPVGNVPMVSEAIEEALSDRARLAALGAAGRERCADALSPRKIAEDTVGFYQSIR